jgi:hypothetical protein
MLRSLTLAGALAFAAQVTLLPAHASDRTLPMRFELRLQGPAESCGAKCQAWISASGAITADSGRDFQQFAQAHNSGRDLANATVVLDSGGGSVLGAIALGREIRRLALAATIGRVVDLAAGAKETPRATLSPRGDCESMCAFVLLAGVRRSVPPEARVMVHQIWLGDRRDDPTAANYSAEDLVLVQRDIGRLAQYTAEMGASTELLGLALRIPPWEPMHSMTAEELRSTRLATDDAVAPAAATIAAAPPPSEPQPEPRATSGITTNLRASPISETHWAMIDRDGAAVLARHHPLTVEGEDIGSFDLAVACGAGGTSYDVSYSERRHNGERWRVPAELARVTLRVGDGAASLKVTSSERRREPDELISYAAATVPAALIGNFASIGNHSLVIETESKGTVTVIRLGNTGAQLNLPRLAASCVKGVGDRAELAPIKKISSLAVAQ